jgi:hypothetical protein
VPVDRFDEGLDRALAELAGLEWVTRVSVWSSAGTRAVRRGQWQAARNAPALALPEALHEISFDATHLSTLRSAAAIFASARAPRRSAGSTGGRAPTR